MIDIHDYPKRLKYAVQLVTNSSISLKNKELIFSFKEHCTANGVSIARISRYLGVLKDWAVLLSKDFDKCSKPDMVRAVGALQENNKYSASD